METMSAETRTAFKQLAQIIQEAGAAANEGRQALRRLASVIARRDHRQALIVRAFLLSLYNGSNPTVDLSEIITLDWSLRKDLCAVMLGLNGPEFPDSDIRSAFIEVGDADAAWLLENATD